MKVEETVKLTCLDITSENFADFSFKNVMRSL